VCVRLSVLLMLTFKCSFHVSKPLRNLSAKRLSRVGRSVQFVHVPGWPSFLIAGTVMPTVVFPMAYSASIQASAF
jgi:hypothetical protein